LSEIAGLLTVESSLLSPLSGMRRIASRDRLKLLSPSNLFGLDSAVGGLTISDSSNEKIKRVSSSSSISSLGNYPKNA
jgi:regulatory associated protein of mTOR